MRCYAVTVTKANIAHHQIAGSEQKKKCEMLLVSLVFSYSFGVPKTK